MDAESAEAERARCMYKYIVHIATDATLVCVQIALYSIAIVVVIRRNKF